MPDKSPVEFNMLDVGSRDTLRGDVNIVLFRDQTFHRRGENIIVANPSFLPFKNDAFDVAFSAFAIGQVKKPFVMLKEMCRVAKRKVVVRYWHKWGSGASGRQSIYRFSEEWFRQAGATLDLETVQFANSIDYPVSGRLKNLQKNTHNSKAWRSLQHFERWSRRIHKVPLEMEAWFKKSKPEFNSGNVKFVVVYNNQEAFKRYFSSSPYAASDKVVAYFNAKNEPLPKFYNQTVQNHLNEDTWFVFCHQDFVLQEDLSSLLKQKDIQSIYGPIGVRLGVDGLLGQITQTNNTSLGTYLTEDAIVQTIDAQCIIAHASVFRQGLRFDERFQFHFYDADFCMAAYTLGFDVCATQIKCQHKSRTIRGDINSLQYKTSLAEFKEKWTRFLPIKTSTVAVECNEKV